MKELKFRVWEEREKAYDTWSYILDESGNLFRDAYGAWIGCDKKDYIVERYTGLIDKNGKEIYEGDVVKVNDDFDEYGINAGEIYEVYFNAGGFRCKPKYGLFLTRGDRGFWIDDGNDYEVIGNVHENADLLEEE